MLETKQTNKGLVIIFEGKLDSLNANDVFTEVENILKDNNGDVVLDFENLEYISSAGLQVVLMCAQKTKEKGHLIYVYKPKDIVDEVLNISGFYTFIKKIDSL